MFIKAIIEIAVTDADMSVLLEVVGLSAGAIGVIAWGPQIKRVWVHKRHDGISIPTFGIVALSLFLWLIYGIAIDSIAMIIANILTLSVILIIIIGVLRCRRYEMIDDEIMS